MTCDFHQLEAQALSEPSRSLIQKLPNIIFAAGDDYSTFPALNEAIQHAQKLRKKIVLITPSHISNELLRREFGIGAISSVIFHEEYQSEAADRVIFRLTPSPLIVRSSNSTSASSEIPAAEALVDTKFKDRLNSTLTMPDWKSIWLVSPFASDVQEWRLGRRALSSQLARQAHEGKKVTFITRPPESLEDDEKMKFLNQLEIDQVTVLINDCLHAKIYLFEDDNVRCCWFLGSHNLTVAGLSRWRDVSLVGFRRAEYLEAKQAMDMIQNHRDTMPYYLWKAQQTKLPRGMK